MRLGSGVAVAVVQPAAQPQLRFDPWELPYILGAALKIKQNKVKKQKFNDKNIIVATLNGLISFLTIFHPPKF